MALKTSKKVVQGYIANICTLKNGDKIIGLVEKTGEVHMLKWVPDASATKCTSREFCASAPPYLNFYYALEHQRFTEITSDRGQIVQFKMNLVNRDWAFLTQTLDGLRRTLLN